MAIIEEFPKSYIVWKLNLVNSGLGERAKSTNQGLNNHGLPMCSMVLAVHNWHMLTYFLWLQRSGPGTDRHGYLYKQGG